MIYPISTTVLIRLIPLRIQQLHAEYAYQESRHGFLEHGIQMRKDETSLIFPTHKIRKTTQKLKNFQDNIFLLPSKLNIEPGMIQKSGHIWSVLFVSLIFLVYFLYILYNICSFCNYLLCHLLLFSYQYFMGVLTLFPYLFTYFEHFGMSNQGYCTHNARMRRNRGYTNLIFVKQKRYFYPKNEFCRP